MKRSTIDRCGYGHPFSVSQIKSRFGHFGGILAISQAAPMITWFMEN
jgi:hypothetical protein